MLIAENQEADIANDCFVSEKTGHVLINGGNLLAQELAKKHNLTRANVCGARVRFTGPIVHIHKFINDPKKYALRYVYILFLPSTVDNDYPAAPQERVGFLYTSSLQSG